MVSRLQPEELFSPVPLLGLCLRGEQAGELQCSPGCVAVSIQGRESQPLLTEAGISLCGYSIPEKALEVYFSKIIHKD